MDLIDLKRLARRARDHRLVLPLLEYPFRRLRDAGVAIPLALYQHLPHRGEFTTQVPGGRSFRMIAHGDYVENCVFWQGVHGYEPECIDTWIALARRARRVLDVGANTGLYSLVAAAAGESKRVHAFEPVERIAARMRRNVALNPALDISVHQVAVGAAAGTANLYDPGGDNCYSASLNGDFLAGSTKRATAVEVVAIDDLARSGGWDDVDLVKLDVEGFEEFALEGMRETLARHRPSLMMEFLSESNDRLNDVLRKLLASGYGLYHLRADGLERSDGLRRSPHGMNVLLAPPERVAAAELRMVR